MPSALAAYFALGWRQASAERVGHLGRILLYGLILLIFWQLWQATPLAGSGLDASRLYWYMAVTECVAIAIGYPFRAVERDILTGQIAAALTRPVPYALAMLAEWAGSVSQRVLVLALAGIVIGLWLTGTVAIPLALVPLLLLSTAMACVLVLLCQLQLGYAAAWIGAAAPPFWIWQKLMFVLGGLILPLSLYPAGLRTVALLSPFAGMLYAPGSLLLDGSARALVGQGIWLAVLAAMTWAIDRAASRRFAWHGV